MADLVYFITSDKIGSQDEELGQTLMKNFLLKLVQAYPKPTHILFVERGVKLLLPDYPALVALQNLQAQGVRLLACETCLDYYGIKDQIAVGEVSNMLEIVETMTESEKVITI